MEIDQITVARAAALFKDEEPAANSAGPQSCPSTLNSQPSTCLNPSTLDPQLSTSPASPQSRCLSTLNPQLSTSPPDWSSRADQFREAEWRNLHKLLIMLGRLALRTGLRSLAPRPSETARLFEAFAKIGRLCTGLDTDPDSDDNFEPPPLPLSLKAAIERIYGPKPTSPSQPGRDGSPNRPVHTLENSQPSTLNSQQSGDPQPSTLNSQLPQ